MTAEQILSRLSEIDACLRRGGGSNGAASAVLGALAYDLRREINGPTVEISCGGGSGGPAKPASGQGEGGSRYLREDRTWPVESVTTLSSRVAELGRGLLSLGSDRPLSATLTEFNGAVSRTITVSADAREA